METVNDNAAMLSNFEVYSLLSDIQAGRGQKKPSKHQQHLATITYETVKYLENTPCVNHTEEIVNQFMKDLEPFKLMRAEKLQIINQCPTSAVEIQLIVEESEERLSEDQIYELLEVIGKYTNKGEEEGEGQEEAEEEHRDQDG
ncbi:hypothetical protein FSP39_002052 [Pinctada imbricata]|uniref:DNA-directed RNA polymerase III subunit RPC9 n=1 Tax=Pinctada imbricata TaxID=66713 RepID=A0AA88XRP3_PINIB|nr:hypothetical protein FSP39_002052 [Pinctada imbricata]